MAYWLFKSEPDEYGIDDLANAPGKTGRWDGIRNFQARNFLRDEVAVGDLVLFYHSGCKVPGIAGTAKVIRAAYPDPSQFDPDSPGYDPKATEDKPRWFCVDVKHGDTFSEFLPARDLKKLPPLKDMVLFRQGRLSVQPVTEREWQTIVDLGRR